MQVHVIALQRLPVWLFSSGPIGDPPKPDAATVDVSAYAKGVRLIDHRVFAGRLVKRELGFAERAIATALRAPDGDFRPWPDIELWATEIAERLEVAPN
jgi:menaquinone-dependent protoporphyrinogen oxidase